MNTTNASNNTVQPNQQEQMLFTDKAPQFPFLLRRLGEFLLTSIVCSLPIAIIYQIGLLPKSDEWALKIMGASLFFFIFITAYLLRAFFYSMGNKRVYYNVNVAGYLLFAIINIVTLIIFQDETLPSLYSYLFMPMKFTLVLLKTIGANTARTSVQILAPILTHIFMYVVIVVAPLEMYSFDKNN